MLRHTPTEGAQSGEERLGAAEAAQVRVTPEELIQAMAAIEARREQEAREREGTIAIREAVQELGLDASPEEILAAVQAQRSRPVQPIACSRRPRFRSAALMAASLTLGLFLVWNTITVAVALPAPATVAPPAEVSSAEITTRPMSRDLDGDGRIDLLVPLNVPDRYDFSPPPIPTR